MTVEAVSRTSVRELQVEKGANVSSRGIAFGLALTGFAIQVAITIWTSIMFAFFYDPGLGFYGGGMMGAMMNGFYRGAMGSYYSSGMLSGWVGGAWLSFSALVIVLGAIGLWEMKSRNERAAMTGSALVLIAALVAFPTMWGLLVGSSLMVAGGVIEIANAP
ncbi:MAG TPA: hypothetical protein VFF30_09970 [Nitrososphaerales archaeon]|nr:hypothetical protein [Nitrososphaerales archaeon]